MEITIEIALFVIAGMISFSLLALLGIIVSVRVNGESKENDEYSHLPKCNCKDVNHCKTWCIVKQRFHENPPTD